MVADARVAAALPVAPSASSASSPKNDLTHPSIDLLRALATGKKDLRELFDRSIGVAVIVVGPTMDPVKDTTGYEHSAKKICDEKKLSEVKGWLDRTKTENALKCEGLSCVHEPQGEWDSRYEIAFERKATGLVIVRLETVLDVPLRMEAEGDFKWAAAQWTKLQKQSCP